MMTWISVVVLSCCKLCNYGSSFIGRFSSEHRRFPLCTLQTQVSLCWRHISCQFFEVHCNYWRASIQEVYCRQLPNLLSVNGNFPLSLPRVPHSQTHWWDLISQLYLEYEIRQSCLCRWLIADDIVSQSNFHWFIKQQEYFFTCRRDNLASWLTSDSVTKNDVNESLKTVELWHWCY